MNSGEPVPLNERFAASPSGLASSVALRVRPAGLAGVSGAQRPAGCDVFTASGALATRVLA